MANRIEIDNLTEVELSDLNHRIVERLRFLHQARAHSRMLEFSVGDKVAFNPDGYETLFGVLTRYNKKTVTVITEQGQRWNVGPASLRRIKDVDSGNMDQPNVIELRKK